MKFIIQAGKERLESNGGLVLGGKNIFRWTLMCRRSTIPSRTRKEAGTYKGTDGYAPNFAYVGAEGYMLNCELRPGTQHCQKGTPEFLRETFDLLGKVKTDYSVLLRMDAGNDAAVNVQQCREFWYCMATVGVCKKNGEKMALTCREGGICFSPMLSCHRQIRLWRKMTGI